MPSRVGYTRVARVKAGRTLLPPHGHWLPPKPTVTDSSIFGADLLRIDFPTHCTLPCARPGNYISRSSPLHPEHAARHHAAPCGCVSTQDASLADACTKNLGPQISSPKSLI